mmetsp:Transcript_32370/g.54545  ORF Transcript_32370/g.54545 Transcript_32370/m.54545 type:complete len:260 (+) Transcript_32370:447-1226(+)
MAVSGILWKVEVDCAFDAKDVTARLGIDRISLSDTLTPLTTSRRVYRLFTFSIQIVAVALLFGVFNNAMFHDDQFPIISAVVWYLAGSAISGPTGIEVMRAGVSYEPIMTKLASVMTGGEPHRSKFLHKLHMEGYAFKHTFSDGLIQEIVPDREVPDIESPADAGQTSAGPAFGDGQIREIGPDRQASEIQNCCCAEDDNQQTRRIHMTFRIQVNKFTRLDMAVRQLSELLRDLALAFICKHLIEKSSCVLSCLWLHQS